MKKVLMIIMLLIVSSVLAQQKNYFTSSEIDSLHSKLQHRKQLIKEVNLLDISLKYSDSIINVYENKNKVFESILIDKNSQLNLQTELINNKDKEFINQKKMYRKKGFYTFLKGVLIGGIITLLVG